MRMPKRKRTCRSGDGNNNPHQEPAPVSRSGKNWIKPDVEKRNYRYEPYEFFRSHCCFDGSSNPADAGTSVWDVAFEPGKPEVVATCGGKFICVFHLNTGELRLKYEHNEWDQDFYCLAWTCLQRRNFLASGSNLGEIRLFDLNRKVSFYSWTYKKTAAINAVQFHSEEPSWLFTASNDGIISLWDIGSPNPPRYLEMEHTKLIELELERRNKDLYCMAWVGDNGAGMIMVGTMDGLMGWRISSERVKEERFGSYQPQMIEFRVPGVPVNLPYVDSVYSLGDHLMAIKCVGLGRIIVFRADFNHGALGETQVEVEPLLEFAWKKTDQFFMNIGGVSCLGLVACGDNLGDIWVNKIPSCLSASDGPLRVAPLGILPWPALEYEEGDLKVERPMMNKVAISPTGRYIVGVTNNNIVAVWRNVSV